MLSVFSTLRALSPESVTLRMLLAVLCGGAIGLERTFRCRPAGLRTHMLICLGACTTMLVSQFQLQCMHQSLDISRLGAQVVAGVGFIGAGTIIVTRHQRVKGLTTAAGLWTAAIVGLALGAGFYEGGLLVAALVLTAEILFSRVERMVLRRSPEMSLFLHFDNSQTLEEILAFLRDKRVQILSMEITRPAQEEAHKATAIFLLRPDRSIGKRKLPEQLRELEGVASVEVLSG